MSSTWVTEVAMNSDPEPQRVSVEDKSIESRYKMKKIDAGPRSFVIDLLTMTNGCFVSLSEGVSARMGAVSLSVRTERGASTSSLIPDRGGTIFAGMLGELLAERLKGIVVTSLHLRENLDTSTMKTLLNEIGALVGGTGPGV
jgi:hypothetical protein